MFNRSSGIFMNISSLPSDFAIGDFGDGCYRFIEQLTRMGMKWWQILPLCPVGKGNSPYSSTSSFAINPYYIDLNQLKEQGLLNEQEVDNAKYGGEPYTVDYDYVNFTKTNLLRLAFERFDKSQMQDFKEQHSYWLIDYAKFMAYKRSNDFAPFWEWQNEYSEYDFEYYIFEQYIASSQWKSVKRYANECGIQILGDMPIYVSKDSADFWSNTKYFCVDENNNLTKAAGIPPDYFCADGQLWGNPIYDWNALKSDNYNWWVERIGSALRIYDAVRIDHFTGFYKYWAVDVDAQTARDGKWEQGPGKELFDVVNKAFSNPMIIAEDLGVSDPEILDFVESTGYPGMKVMQFGFSSYDSTHLPYKYNENTVAYTGTHDNDTTLGWLWSISQAERSSFLSYCRFYGDNWGEGGDQSAVMRAIISSLWQTSALLTIVPIQDVCGFGTDTRLNTPGVPEGNWRFRITYDALSRIDNMFFSDLNRTYGR